MSQQLSWLRDVFINVFVYRYVYGSLFSNLLVYFIPAAVTKSEDPVSSYEAVIRQEREYRGCRNCYTSLLYRIEYFRNAFSTSTLLVGWQAVKTEWWGAGMVVWQEQGANDLHIVQRMPLPPHHFLLQYIPEWFTFPVQVVLEKAVIRIVILNTLVFNI